VDCSPAGAISPAERLGVGWFEMNHPLPYRGNDPAIYEAALLKLFRKYPPSRLQFSITIYEQGKLSGKDMLIHQWPAAAKTIQEHAKQMAETIVAECKRLTGRPIKGLMLDF
jgi:hypothetical protein